MYINVKKIPRDVLVVGASAGGHDPMLKLLASLPAEPPLVVAVVMHRGPFGGRSLLRDMIARCVSRPVVEPTDAIPVTPGVIYLGPRDLHIVFEGDQIRAVRAAKQHFTRPAIDPLFSSAAQLYGTRVTGVLLSGGGADGVVGLIRIKACGGISLVQLPSEAQNPNMPLSALREDHVDAALALEDLIRAVPALASGRVLQTNGIGADVKPWAWNVTKTPACASRHGCALRQ